MIVLCFFMMGRGGGCMGFGNRNRRRAANGHGGHESADEILDRRYASGEINGSEYEEIKGRIKSNSDGE